jgi:hypothetical protein
VGRLASQLQELLDLTDDELLEILGATPLDVMLGEEDEREDVRVLVQLTRELAEAAPLPRWVRAPGPDGRPIDLLLARDFAGYETALATLAERGFVIRRSS